MAVTSGAGAVNNSEASGVRVARSLVFYIMFCRSLFVLLSFFFFWPLYRLQFTASDYPSGIFNRPPLHFKVKIQSVSIYY
jgi:hypothetical protein